MDETELLERDDERAVLTAEVDASRAGGRIVVVAGEAGIGKTALVTATCRPTRARRVLWGGCDPLVTPRALGPVWDVARDVDGPLLALLERAASREEVLAALLDELEAGASSVLVVEDLHWADDASLDLLALLARRLPRARGCLVLTCRTDALAERPEVRNLLAALPRDDVRRLDLAPLSERAVEQLARGRGRDATQVHALTGGNPFLVTEALSALGDGAVPPSVRDALAQRMDALAPPARAVVELAAVVPGQVEVELLEDAIGAEPGAVDACVAAGILELRAGGLTFRHELARRAVEDELTPMRHRELDRLVLRALEARGDADPARLAHHARRAGDLDAIRRLAPPAARAASAAGGHRQALEHWEAALAAGDAPDDGGAATAAALEGVSGEAYLCGRVERALETRRALHARHEADGDALRTGDDLRWLSRMLWWAGDGAEAERAGDRAIEVLEAFPGSRELAMAISGRAQLAMLAQQNERAIELGERAVQLGRELGDHEIVAHALTNVGTALMYGPRYEEGRDLLEEAHRLAAAHGHDDHAARALVNLAYSTTFQHRDDPRVGHDIARALEFVVERNLEAYVQYVRGTRANRRLMTGDWAGAEADARAALAPTGRPGVFVSPAMVALGRLLARRGDPETDALLERAWSAAQGAGELQRLAPVAVARAEHAWLAGDLRTAADAVDRVYDVALRIGDPWTVGELAFWRRRAGGPAEAPDGIPEPYARAIAGDPRGAAAAWEALGFPYDAADALADGDEDDRLRALATFDRLGADRAAARLRRLLRAAGVRRVPRGPRPASRQALAGLTPRQLEVLDLVAAGATNAEIAARLVISEKTVDHHVSAILAKLGVGSRRDAAAAAAALADGDDPAPRWGPAPDVTGMRRT